jgi:hypothetical protein
MPPKSRRRPVSTDRRFRKQSQNADHGPPERWQHSGRLLQVTEKNGVLAARTMEEHIIDMLVLRGTLNENQSVAAFKFKLDYQRAGLAAHTTGGYNPIRVDVDSFHGRRERNNFEEAAYQRWRNAVRELGCRHSAVVITVACHDLLPTPREILLLQEGLEKLLDWYKLPKERR